ncbi:MAG: hypothetical protein E2O83_08455 [Bacteroidetes bacterium]|nr:MAG: hypothetical protein E2O83_08455 [Bacteroidota bacterium]
MNRLGNLPIFLISLLILVFSSCQKEKEEFIDETNEEETINLDSVLTGMLLSASQNNGYIDDIIDNSDCISVALPVTVFANEQKVIIEDESDYDLIVAIFAEFENDIDTLEIVFPISVIFEDYNQIEVGSQGILNIVVAACQNIVENTYSCIDFVYPIECFTYDVSNEQTGLVTLETSFDWFWYLNYLNENILIAINYPIRVILDGTVSIINSNDELLAYFTQTNCETNTTIDPTKFELNLTSGFWFVILYDEDGIDETCNYAGYEFNFNTNGTATATSDTEIRYGFWTLEDNDGELDLLLKFDVDGQGDPFEDLNEDWDVLENTPQIIKLKDESGGNNTVDHLYFGRDPIATCSSGNAQVLINALIDGQWFVETYLNDGIDQTGTYSDFAFTFKNSGIVVATSSIYTYYGTWSVSGTNDLELVLDFGTQIPLDEFNRDWDVLNFDTSRVELEDVSSGGGTDTLILEKI